MNFIRKILTELKRKKYQAENQWFLWPVPDTVQGYREVVQFPMDMSTMEKKLNEKKYSGVEEFYDDMKLMFRNCYT